MPTIPPNLFEDEDNTLLKEMHELYPEDFPNIKENIFRSNYYALPPGDYRIFTTYSGDYPEKYEHATITKDK